MTRSSFCLLAILPGILISCTNKFNDAEESFRTGQYEKAYTLLSTIDSTSKDFPSARRMMVLATIRQYSLLTDSLLSLYQRVDENVDSLTTERIKSTIDLRRDMHSRLTVLEEQEQLSRRLNSNGLRGDSIYDVELNPSRIALANINCIIATWQEDYSSAYEEARSAIKLITRGKEAGAVDEMVKEINKRERQRRIAERSRRLFGRWDWIPFFGSGGCRGRMNISSQWLEVVLYCSSPFYSFDRKYFIKDIKWKANGDVTLVCQGVDVTLAMEEGGFASTEVRSYFDPEAKIILGGKRFHK